MHFNLNFTLKKEQKNEARKAVMHFNFTLKKEQKNLPEKWL